MNSIDLCNRALSKLGVKERITSLTATDKLSQLCNDLYEVQRKKLLCNYSWSFATVRSSLVTPLVAAPAWGFGNAFALPSDCLKVISLDNPYISYLVEGNKLLSNESSINIKYTSDVDDVDSMSPLFIELFILLLAANMAFPVLKDRNMQLDITGEFKDAQREARSLTAQEANNPMIIVDTWLDSRYSGIGDPGDRSFFWE